VDNSNIYISGQKCSAVRKGMRPANWTVEMAAFSNAFSRSGQMATSVDKVRPLDGSLDLIGHCAFEWPEKATT